MRATNLNVDAVLPSDERTLTRASSVTLLSDVVKLTKPRLSALVMLTALVGFYFGTRERIDLPLLLDATLGIGLVAMGASALNQFLERNVDGLMQRTKDRPLPARRLTASQVLYFGALSATAGMVYLLLRVNADAALLAAMTLGLYVFAYTPLKQVTSLNTLVGAIPGALPPLIGYAAARGALTPQAWALFAILFIWQLPHFLAIAWLYREDYDRAGFKMLPKVDVDGFSTGRQVVVHSVMLIPVSLAPFVLHMAGLSYVAGALFFGVVFLFFGIKFAANRTDAAARKLFLASVIYLPLLLALMMLDGM